jgi:Na+/alanine symporter
MPTWLVVAAIMVVLLFAAGIYFTVRTGGMSRRREDEAEEMREKARANSNVFWGS